MRLESFIPYNVPFEETLMSVVSSIFFKELELLKYPKKKLSEIIEKPQYGFTSTASREAIGIKYVRITDIQAGKIDWHSVPHCVCDHPEKYLLKKDDILFARTGTTGKSYIVKGEIPRSIFASYLIRIRTKQGVNPDFLYWFLQTKQYWSQIKKEKIGSVQLNVNAKKFSSLEVCVPETKVQEDIARYLNVYKRRTYGESVRLPILPATIKHVVGKTLRVRRLMIRIEKVEKLRTESIENVKTLILEILKNIRSKLTSSNHPKKRIAQITNVTSGGTPSRNNPTYWEGTIPWIKSGELKDEDIWDAEEYITEEGLRNSSAKLFPPNSVIVALYGQGQTRGRTGRLAIEASTNQACCAILPNPSRFIPRFLQYWLRSLYLEMREKYRDGAQPNWNGRMIKNIEVVLPPLDVQSQVVAYLSSIEKKMNEVKRLQEVTQEQMEELVVSILDKAF